MLLHHSFRYILHMQMTVYLVDVVMVM